MAIKPFEVNDAINEKSDAEYSCVFTDAAADEPAIEAAAILTIAATLTDVASGAVINSRNAQDVKNAAGGTLAEDGTFTLRLTGNVDNRIVGTLPVGNLEQHKLQLAVTYQRSGGATGYLNHEVLFYVRNLTRT